MLKSNEIKILDNLQEAFSGRSIPSSICSSDQLSKDEYSDIEFLIGKHWQELTSEELENHHELIYWLSPKAFCYYLPGILSSGLKSERPDLLIYHSIIEMLDRSPNPTDWDDFFLERWPLLNAMECEAVQEWLLWISSYETSSLYENTFSRALETLELLKQGVTAIRSNLK